MCSVQQSATLSPPLAFVLPLRVGFSYSLLPDCCFSLCVYVPKSGFISCAPLQIVNTVPTGLCKNQMFRLLKCDKLVGFGVSS